MRYGSVCSGIEAPTAAWHDLGWEPVWFSEIEKFPSACLEYHYPDVPNLGDMTKLKENSLVRSTDIDVLVGGTPCQSFSVAGLRKGLDDPRGNLALEFLALADRIKPRWILWENVPGLLSSSEGRDFGAFLGALGKLGYGFAYRVLDAQYVRVQSHARAVPQRRRRVFVVGCLGDWRSAAAVLFEQEGLQGHPPPSRKAGAGTFANTESGSGVGSGAARALKASDGGIAREDGHTLIPAVAGSLSDGAHNGGGMNGQDAYAHRLIPEVANVLTSRMHKGINSNVCEGQTPIVLPIHDKATRHQGGGDDRNDDGAANGLGIGAQGDPCPTMTVGDQHAIAFQSNGNTDDIHAASIDVSTTMRPGGAAGYPPAIAFKPGQSADGGLGIEEECAPTLEAGGGGNNKPAIVCPAITATNDPSRSPQSSEITQQVAAVYQQSMEVRRLTPLECERLQGFPDGYTMIPWRGKAPEDCPDGPRYKALGNSMAVNVMRWLGERIQMVDEIS